MRTLTELRKETANRMPRFTTEIIDIRGEESLIFDPRSHMKPAEHVERKLQDALRADDQEHWQARSSGSN